MNEPARFVRLIRRWPIATNVGVSAFAAAAIAAAAVASGSVNSTNATLMLMGFDADRAQLITSLLVAGGTAGAVVLLANRQGQGVLAGLGSFAALFAYTFAHQTHRALQSSGANGSFDLVGWLLTGLTLLLAGLISSWAGATLAGAVRPTLADAGLYVGDAIRRRRPNRRLLRRALMVAGVFVWLVVCVPVFGDMVNYTTDARMLHGGPQPIGLIPQTAPQANGTDSSGPRPWLSWKPSGGGATTVLNLPVPWTGGASTTEDIGIYTPPGYDPHGQRRYPVLYEAPFDYQAWDSALNIKVALDSLVDSGAIPPMIVVFINAWRSPAAITDCADPSDGKPGIDTFISQTVVSYVDSNYMTMGRADARAVTGFSTGGYCAAIMPLRHPTVFGTGIPISGYFWADEGTANSAQANAGNEGALAAASPMVAATELPADVRAKLFFVVVAKSSQPFFGVESAQFEHLLSLLGYNYVAQEADLPHGWDQVRARLPGALEAWAAHLVAVGVL